MTFYTVKTMSKCFDIGIRTINCMIFFMQLEPMFTQGFNHERYYSIYQMELIKLKMEKKKRKMKIELDFCKNEINIVYESKLNHLTLKQL